MLLRDYRDPKQCPDPEDLRTSPCIGPCNVSNSVNSCSSCSRNLISHNDELRSTYAHQVEEHFVGMEDDIMLLVALMEDHSRRHRVISIYGMAGLGKTTLTKDQAWELLQKIAFPAGHEIGWLEAIGRQIVRKCGLLPLAVSVIGGSLRGKQTSAEWERVHDNIDSYMRHGEGIEECTKVNQVLDLSFNALPYPLKSCFLYLRCYAEDDEIVAERLYSLWIAEGFISFEDKGRTENLRDVAERYLRELALRCMVQVRKDDISSRHEIISSCRLHDLMRDLCASKGEEKGLIKVIDLANYTWYKLAIHFVGC